MLLATCRLPQHLTTSGGLADLGLHGSVISHRNTEILSDAPHRRSMIMFSFCQIEGISGTTTCRQLPLVEITADEWYRPLQPAPDFRVGLKTLLLLQSSISTTTAAAVRAQTA
eukprot:scaffold356921_cov15-Prasinocladus_malaysianus.AAC.1